jgi:hypothetical protein
MPITPIHTVWELVRFLCRKYNSAYLDPEQFNLVINRAQMTKFMEMYGNPQEYQPGRPIPKISYEVTQKVIDDLKQFKEDRVLQVDKEGKASYPDNYVHTLSLGYRTIKYSNCKGSEPMVAPIEVVDQDKEMYRRSSYIVAPSRKRPICVLKNSYYQFYPEGIGVAEVSYLRQPKQAKYAVKIVNNRPVYDPDKSVHLEWPDVAVNDIVMRALSYIGISIKDEEIVGYTEMKRTQGV